MKKILFVIGLFWSIVAMAQEPSYTPMRSNYKFRGVRIDSLFMAPTFADTATANSIGLNSIVGNIIRIDSSIYVRYNNKWVKQAGGTGGTTTIDTTSLSNRINLKVDSINRIGDSVYFYKNGVKYFAFKDSIGSTSGFVPYTGASQDVDLGNNGLTAKFIKVTGTAGTGHIDMKHQSGNPSGQANSTILFANSSGYLKWKNDNLYFSTFATPQSADRVYTTQDKSYVLGDSADIAARVKYTDTASMLTNYQRSVTAMKYSDTASMLTNYQRSVTAMKYSDTASMLTNYQRSVTAMKYSDTASMLTNYQRSVTAMKYSDTVSMLTNYQRSVTAVKYNDTASMLTNYQRTTSFPIATFGGGSGAAGDTVVFTTSAIYGAFYNSGGDTIVLTGYTAACQGTSPSITPTIYFNDSLNTTAGATKVVTSPSAVTSTTSGNTVTSLNNTKIPPGNFVWVVSETVTTKPTFFTLTLIGYRKR